MKKDDYAYKTIEEYEKILGQKVNDAFRIGWDMARMMNSQFVGKDTAGEKDECDTDIPGA